MKKAGCSAVPHLLQNAEPTGLSKPQRPACMLPLAQFAGSHAPVTCCLRRIDDQRRSLCLVVSYV
jgi:hypothetical protein